MDVNNAIKERKSIRAYKDLEVEDEKLSAVLEAARLAPSANNRQEWKFIVVKDKEKIQRLAVASRNQTFVAQAPVLLVACATESEKVMTCGQPTYTVDLSIAVSFIILEAQEQGLGTCWLGAFFEDQVKEILDIPQNVRVVAMTPLGYAEVAPPAKPRKASEDIICFDSYK